MIFIKIYKKQYKLPGSWQELTFQQWYDLQSDNLTWYNIISILTGVSVELLKEVKPESLMNIIPLISWIKNKCDLEQLPAPTYFIYRKKKYLIPSDISTLTWGQKIALHQLMIEAKEKDYICFAVAVYMLPIINKKQFNPDGIEAIESFALELRKENLFTLYPVANHFIKQALALIETETKTLSRKPKSKHIRAGIKMFDELGVFNTIDMLADGDVLKYAAVQKVEYNTIYLKLLLNHRTAIFRENLNKVLKEKK